MTRAQAQVDCERRRLLIESRAVLEFTAYFAQRKLPFPNALRIALTNCSRESCRVGDLCAFERLAAGESWDPDKTPDGAR